MGKSEILIGQCYSQTVFFDWRIIPHTTVSKHTQNYDVILMQQVHCNTSNMVAVTVVNGMT